MSPIKLFKKSNNPKDLQLNSPKLIILSTSNTKMIKSLSIIPNNKMFILGHFTFLVMYHGIITGRISIQLNTKAWLKTEKLLATPLAVDIELVFVFYEDYFLVFYVKCKNIFCVVCVFF